MRRILFILVLFTLASCNKNEPKVCLNCHTIQYYKDTFVTTEANSTICDIPQSQVHRYNYDTTVGDFRSVQTCK